MNLRKRIGNFVGNFFKPSKPVVTINNINEHIEETVTEIYDMPVSISKKPRPHQIEALSILRNHSIGQVCIPTGTGKTFIQLMLHIHDMIEKQKNNEYGIYVIAAHRLVLCNQLFKEFVYETKFINSFDCDFLSVSSDSYTIGSLHKSMEKNSNVSKADVKQKLSRNDVEVKSTTVKSEIKKFVDNSKANKKHCVIIATYDSFDRLSELSNIDVCTYDEAHEITKEDYFTNVEKIKPKIKKQIFFTATRKESDCKRGMNQIDFYGEVLFEKSPREMIEAGEIIRPNNIHTIIVKNDEGYDYDNPVMTIRAITEGFIEHKALVKKHSFKPNLIGAKLLIACDGSAQLRNIISDMSFRFWCEQRKIRVFSVNAEDGEWVDFEQVNSRNTFMDKLNGLKDDEDAIFFHIKILTEGIDLPAITGIMPIRDMDRTTLTQTLGRATRLLKEDRRRLYLPITDSEKIYPTQDKKFVKPWAWVLIPNYLLDDSNQILNIINDVYDNYGVRPDRFSESEKYMAMAEFPMSSINDADEINKKFKDGELSHVFTFSEMIELKTNQMSDEEQSDLALNILDNYNA
jgi:superfamily II DNA or RNA helicase